MPLIQAAGAVLHLERPLPGRAPPLSACWRRPAPAAPVPVSDEHKQESTVLTGLQARSAGTVHVECALPVRPRPRCACCAGRAPPVAGREHTYRAAAVSGACCTWSVHFLGGLDHDALVAQALHHVLQRAQRSPVAGCTGDALPGCCCGEIPCHCRPVLGKVEPAPFLSVGSVCQI